jgi:FlaA1/EpsC-like NDP-sugar epimerase
VFHVAAQRDPGLAEIEVHRTVSTNVLGTRTVLTAAAEAGVPQVVCASTGKALRPYSPDMYTASKRAAEWVASGVAAGSGMLISVGRFTHVLDNSIIYKRLLSWADESAEVIRLHSPDIAFYVQSALESAQLLLLACLGAERPEFRVFAISDLGWRSASWTSRSPCWPGPARPRRSMSAATTRDTRRSRSPGSTIR